MNKLFRHNASSSLLEKFCTVTLLLLFLNVSVLSQYIELEIYSISLTELSEEEEGEEEIDEVFYDSTTAVLNLNINPFLSHISIRNDILLLVTHYGEIFIPPPEFL